MEEQQPVDLFEKEIKEEIEDFVAEVKEEPIFEDDNEQFFPKLEEVLDSCLQSTSSMPTQNAYLNKDSFEQNIFLDPNFIPDLTPRPQNVTSNVLRIPTLNKNSVSRKRIAQFILNDDSVQDQTSEHKTIKSKRSHLCSVCKQSQINEDCKYVTLREEKLIIIIGCKLRGEHNLENPNLFKLDDRKTTNVFICHIHFSEAFTVICKFLFINSPDEISSCSLESIQILMSIVDDLNHRISPLEFRTSLCDFALRNKIFIEMLAPLRLNFEDFQNSSDFPESETKEGHVKKESRDDEFEKTEPNIELSYEQIQSELISLVTDSACTVSKKQQKTRRCSVCSQSQPRDHLNSTYRENEKVLIMVGCILRSDYTLEHAKSFMSADNMPKEKRSSICRKKEKKRSYICHVHYSDTISEIYKALNIKSFCELDSCSLESIQNVMTLINALCPKFTTTNLRSILNCFEGSRKK